MLRRHVEGALKMEDGERKATARAAPHTHLQSRRDCVLQPRVARDELPWEISPKRETTLKGLRRHLAVSKGEKKSHLLKGSTTNPRRQAILQSERILKSS
jgi:hypothetical protein